MDSVMSGTLAGTGSFRCAQCGYVVTLAAEDPLPQCPGCHGASFERASLFGASADGRFMRQPAASRSGSDRDAWIARAREAAPGAGEYLAHDADGELQLLPLKREWTRVGRSLAADVRFDDPTVSRRHALLVRQADGVRVLDDRSLNGVFVNGERVDWRALADGDEIVVGRYRLTYIEVAPVAARAAEAAAEA